MNHMSTIYAIRYCVHKGLPMDSSIGQINQVQNHQGNLQIFM